jgi:hypothetical protein
MTVSIKRLSLLFAFVFALVIVFASVANADERIRAGNCDTYGPLIADPIAKTTHQHFFAGGRVQSSSDTAAQIKARGNSTCRADFSEWATSGRWYPDAKGTNHPEKDTLYYRAPGSSSIDQALKPVPLGLAMLQSDIVYKGSLTTVRFGNCLKVANGQPVLDSPDHRAHVRDVRTNACPSTFPYRIPQPAYLIHWSGSLSASTPVSTNDGYLAGSFHADYLAANQDIFNSTLIKRCLIDGAESQDVKHPTCGVGP